MIEFVKNGALTAEGKKLVEHIEAQIKPALDDKNPSIFNSMSGALKHYGVNVSIGGMMTPERWLEDYQRSAEVIYEGLLLAEQQAETTDTAKQAADGVKSLSEQFAELQKQVADQGKKLVEQEAELKTLREANKPAPAKKKSGAAEDENEV